jgi:hypothetical protein
MTNALSNPYELTVGGITCKASPFGTGFYISTRDLYELEDQQAAFKKALFDAYHVEQSKELDGIKVFSRKEVKDGDLNKQTEKQTTKV